MVKAQSWIAIVVAGAGCAIAAFGQNAAGPDTLSAGPAYTSKDGKTGPKFPKVEAVVRLKAADGAPVALKPGELKLFSVGTQLASGSSLRAFGDTGYGVRAILALDLSGSMSGAPLEAVRGTMARFVNQAREEDRVEVVTIADDTRVEVPFGADKATLADRLKNVSSRGTLTRLYDGLLFAMDQLSSGPPELRQLTVITDGHDEGSKHSLDEVIKQATQEKIQIDSIGLTRSHPEFLETLKHISQATGGAYARANSPQELDGLVDRGIQAMRATPVVSFNTEKLAGDGKAHMIEVRWDPGKLAASVDVHTPLIPKPWPVWIWAVVGCVIAAATLLLLAMRRQKKEPAGVSVVSAPPHRTEPLANWPSTTGITESKAAPAPQPPRVYKPTVIEEEASSWPLPASRAPRPAQPQVRPPTQPLESPRPEPRPQARAKTRVAAFFDEAADEHGAVLEATAGPLTGRDFQVKGEFMIGASDGNDLVIPEDPTLSGFHGRVRLADSVLTIEDSRSTNGTHVNGVRLGPGRKLLKPGDEIRMGRSVFRVRSV
jgi:hypothetical protein